MRQNIKIIKRGTSRNTIGPQMTMLKKPIVKASATLPQS